MSSALRDLLRPDFAGLWVDSLHLGAPALARTHGRIMAE